MNQPAYRNLSSWKSALFEARQVIDNWRTNDYRDNPPIRITRFESEWEIINGYRCTRLDGDGPAFREYYADQPHTQLAMGSGVDPFTRNPVIRYYHVNANLPPVRIDETPFDQLSDIAAIHAFNDVEDFLIRVKTILASSPLAERFYLSLLNGMPGWCDIVFECARCRMHPGLYVTELPLTEAVENAGIKRVVTLSMDYVSASLAAIDSMMAMEAPAPAAQSELPVPEIREVKVSQSRPQERSVADCVREYADKFRNRLLEVNELVRSGRRGASDVKNQHGPAAIADWITESNRRGSCTKQAVWQTSEYKKFIQLCCTGKYDPATEAALDKVTAKLRGAK